MKDKMTSGEIAKKTGISQKAIRLYDEKGLLKPTEYTEGNYRLYDKESLIILEKIIALKQVGFSLEEIRENLNQENEIDVYTSLKKQLQLLERKKYQLEKSIACIQRALDRCEDKPDWDSIAEIMRTIQMDQRADESFVYYQAQRNESKDEDWYVKIYRSLDIHKNERVLDLGCGYGKLWRNNWSEIPENVIVDAVDLHGSWADHFEEYVIAHKFDLSVGTDIVLRWQDVEDESTWCELADGGPYHHVIAHYLFEFLQDKELLLKRSADILAHDGVFCCNGKGVNQEFFFWKKLLEMLGVESDFIVLKIEKNKAETEAFFALLKKYFSKVEQIEISSCMRYTNAEDVFLRMTEFFPEKKKNFVKHEGKIMSYFERKIVEEGEFIVDISSTFWHCFM